MEYQKFEGLDGVRGFAAFIVLLSHAGHYGLNIHPALDFTGIGKHGVFLFFSLSSFLLSFQMFSAGTAFYSREYIVHYFHRRIFRVLPLYVIVVLAFWVLAFEAKSGQSYFNGVRSVLAAVTMSKAPGVLWAVPPEFKFYFLLPLIVMLINSFRSRRLFIVTLLLFSIVSLRFVNPPKFSSSPLPFLPIFLSGVLPHTFFQRVRTFCTTGL